MIGLLVSARSLQLGEAVPVIALTSAAANLTTIASGPIVFGEPLPSGQLDLVILSAKGSRYIDFVLPGLFASSVINRSTVSHPNACTNALCPNLA